ncbi:TetR/AcrR family transcriptional regulator [Spongisporangium articulatum]|uniref:TetR/AcrR family transcriptional regulator n=1 Tax=Spongisporangium articulatum TaxID=3362603 RepID=A0ABW8AKH3_9ACTN
MTVEHLDGHNLPWVSELPESSRRMLEAAVDAFADHGFHATTTRDIATRAGLSPAALYVHFPSKGALLAQISRLGHEAALRLVEETLASSTDPIDGLREVIRDFAAWHAQYHRVARVVQYELAALPDGDRQEIFAVRQKIERLVEAQLRSGVAAGVMAVDDERAVARAILSLCVDVARWFDPKGAQTPLEIGTLYAELAVRMVRRP